MLSALTHLHAYSEALNLKGVRLSLASENVVRTGWLQL